jgi:hypothetical protein
MNLTGTMRKMMGWCPQKKIVYRTEDEFISDYAYHSKTHAKDNPIPECMDVPLQMFDWRIWAFFGGFIVLILSVSAWMDTYNYLFPSSFILIALLFIFFHTKLSVGNETLRISTPILDDIIVPRNSIKSIEIFENYGNRHKLRSLVSLAVMIMLSIYFAVAMPNSVMNKVYIIAIFLFIYVFYAAICMSNYPDMIRINAGGRDILLYPRNELDFLILKGIAPAKAD